MRSVECAIFNDLERPLTQISRSRSYYRCPRRIVCAALTRDLFAIAKLLEISRPSRLVDGGTDPRDKILFIIVSIFNENCFKRDA